MQWPPWSLGNEEVEIAMINPLEAMEVIDNPDIEVSAKKVDGEIKASFR